MEKIDDNLQDLLLNSQNFLKFLSNIENRKKFYDKILNGFK